MTSRLRRCELSTPGTSEKMMSKAAASDADLVFLDLEDSVAPAEKKAARALVACSLRDHDWGTKTRAIRHRLYRAEAGNKEHLYDNDKPRASGAYRARKIKRVV